MESLSMSSLSTSALETEDDPEPDMVETQHAADPPPSAVDVQPSRPSVLSVEDLGKDLSDALDTASSTDEGPAVQSETVHVLPHESREPSLKTNGSPSQAPPSTQYATPSDLAAELHSHPKLAALRMPPSLSMTGISGPRSVVSPPILMNPKCSGYFVEPVGVTCRFVSGNSIVNYSQMKWMEPFLEGGHLAGKIVCPKCNAKLGNYDWAGVCCSCREWVTPVRCFLSLALDIM
jgi:dual specificity phosphatase 12